MEHEHILALLAAILACRDSGLYDPKELVVEAADMLVAARVHLQTVNGKTEEVEFREHGWAAKLRAQVDTATRQWAADITRRNMAAGPHEEDFIKIMRPINTVRHEAGLALFEKETDVIGKAVW